MQIIQIHTVCSQHLYIINIFQHVIPVKKLLSLPKAQIPN